MALIDGHGTYTTPQLQTVSTHKADVFTATINNMDKTNITGLAATITPQSTSNKILIVVDIGGCCCRTNGQRYGFGIKRGSTLIGQPTGTDSRTGALYATANFEGGSNGIETGACFHFLDSPSTTSATTYQVWTTVEGNGNTVCINRSDNDSNSSSVFRVTSNITCYEIGG